MDEIVYVATDWWGFAATLVAGILTAIATMSAVIYTNSRTKKQLKEQEVKFENERKEVENKTDIDINEVAISTKTSLRNMNTDALWTYNTNNCTSLLRGRESIFIRVADQTQFEKILSMNADKIPSTLNFECRIEYSTLADQRITYTYEIEICNDRRIEVKKDGIEGVTDLSQKVVVVPTTFRNLQDSISGIDRSAYSWEKMGQASMRGFMSQYSSQLTEQNHTLSNQADADITS